MPASDKHDFPNQAANTLTEAARYFKDATATLPSWVVVFLTDRDHGMRFPGIVAAG